MIAWAIALASASPPSTGVIPRTTDTIPPTADAFPRTTDVIPLPPLPPPPEDAWGIAEIGDVVVARPIADALEGGLDLVGFDRAVAAAIESRDVTYDFVMVLESDAVSSQLIWLAGAFYSPMNNADLSGTGRPSVSRPDTPLRGALWMNKVSLWELTGPDFADWVFGQELGHHWLAYPKIDRGDGPEDLLLGRSGSHWSYFFHTNTSPMEGNTWIDHGDGTFTSAPSQGLGGFCDLDLYMMGLLSPDEVAPFWVIQPAPGIGIPSSTPAEATSGGSPITIAGERIDLTVDHVIAAEGLVEPGPGDSDRVQEILTVLIVAPEEPLTEALLAQVEALQEGWSAAWSRQTRGLSEVSFERLDDTYTLPPTPTPTLIPRGAW